MDYEQITRELRNVIEKEKNTRYDTFSTNTGAMAYSCLQFIEEQQKLLPKKGYWEWVVEPAGNPAEGDDHYEGYQCSICHFELPDSLLVDSFACRSDTPVTKFCPDCGADMRGFSLKNKLEKEGSSFTVEEAQKMNESIQSFYEKTGRRIEMSSDFGLKKEVNKNE